MSRYIKNNILRVCKANLDKTKNFYTKILGMYYRKDTVNGNIYHAFGYQEEQPYKQTEVAFLEDENFHVTYRQSGYWKIGIGLYDVNAGIKKIIENGGEIDSAPAEQFLDVGCMKHLCDPNGYTIELLQDLFKDNFVKIIDSDTDEKPNILGQPKSKPPHLGQITIRSSDIEKSKSFYMDLLGMKLVCIENLTPHYPFALYFFAYTEEVPPGNDLNDVINREWLYSKRFCQIEIQVYPNQKKNYITNDDNKENIKLGHVGFSLVVDDGIIKNIREKGDKEIIVKEGPENTLIIQDPDGYMVYVTCN